MRKINDKKRSRKNSREFERQFKRRLDAIARGREKGSGQLGLRKQNNFKATESTEFTEAALIEGGVRAGFAAYDGRYEIAAFARNVTDDLSRTGGIDFNNLTGFLNDPRVFGLEVRSAFF